MTHADGSFSRSRPTKLPKKLGRGGKSSIPVVARVVAAPTATVVDEVGEVGEGTVTHTAAVGVALAAAGAPPALHHHPGVAVTTTADRLGVVIHTCLATGGLRDDEVLPPGHPRQTRRRVDLVRDPLVQEAADDIGDVTRHLHIRARDLGLHSPERTTTDLAGARPLLAGTRLCQSDGVTRPLGAAHLSDGDAPGRTRLPAPIGDRCHDHGVPYHEGDATGTAGVEALRPVVLEDVEDAN